MLMMYCPNCNKNVITKREDFSLLLAFIFAFTGIGLVIYILYYLDKKKDHCIYCETKCQTKQLDKNQTSGSTQLQNNSQLSLEDINIESEKVKIGYCHNCGVLLGDRVDLKFCALCGSSLN